MDRIKKALLIISKNLKPLFKWLLISGLLGGIGGVLGTIFHKALELVTEIRAENNWLILLLPLAGLLITGLYRVFSSKGALSTNAIIDAVAEDKKVPAILAPLIFVSTLITHLFGGSAGREGAALQLGGSIGYNIGKLLRFSKSDRRVVVMVGMSSFFSAMFGAPLTAAIFAVEVIRVGYVRNCGFMPCIISSTIAYEIAKHFGSHGVRFSVAIPQLSAEILVKVILLAVLCAWVSILFCIAIKKSSSLLHKYIKNSYLRTVVGAFVIVALTLILRTTDYNGAGMHVIENAMSGEATTFAFLLKIIFTAITIAAGFKGGEIVPTLFIGATFGCVAGGVLGLDPGFAASLGLVALFCGVVNCPLASVALALEIFGGDGILIYAIACGVSFMMSGDYSLYKSQRIIFSKITDEQIDAPTQ